MLPGPVSIPPPHASDALTDVMMAEVQALGTGRKIRIDIWTVFNYNLTENKTQCTAITGEKPRGFKIGGKNTGADWGKKVARELVSDRPTQYTARGPLSTRRAAHSIHGALTTQCIARIDQSVAYLEKYPYT